MARGTREARSTAPAALADYALARPSRAAEPTTARAGEFGELDATAPGGIDLHLEHKDLLVSGRPGRAIAINGSIPGPVIRMQEGREALIRVHNRLPESSSIHWHGILLPNEMDGVVGPVPGGGFYVYPSVKGVLGRLIARRTPRTSAELAEIILDEVEVAVVPGEAFGPSGYLRLSYALGDDDLAEGVSRIQRLLGAG